jgi:hypothetical protein
MFLNISIMREKITTDSIEGNKMDEFNREPYDFDYAISPDCIKDVLLNSKPTWEICAVSTHDTSPICPQCKGNGFLRCENCRGSGRQQYVDGNFAGGEERIKTGQCSNCYGTGKIQCDECAGSGKRQNFSEKYQIVKKFENIKKVMSYAVTSNTFEQCAERCYLAFLYGDKIEIRELEAEIEKWNDSFDNQELKNGIRKLHKNQKEVIIDENQTLPDGVSEECKNLYKKNKQAALDYFEGNKRGKNKQGKLGCAIEKHFAIPMFRMYFSTKIDDEEYFIDIYEDTNKNLICCLDSLPELGFFKSLFV